VEKLQEALRQIIDRLSAVEQSAQGLWRTRGEDVAGLLDQLRGSLQTISKVEVELQDLKEHLIQIQGDRKAVWGAHDEKCKHCMERFAIFVNSQIDKWHEIPSRMPLIGFLKHYWWQVVIFCILASAFLQLNEKVVQLAFRFLAPPAH
jgi:hypothetical protein